MEFIQNKGQWDLKINYKGDFSSGAFFLHKNGFTVNLNDTADLRKLFGHGHAKKEKNKDFIFHSFAYNVSFIGANTNPEIVPEIGRAHV